MEINQPTNNIPSTIINQTDLNNTIISNTELPLSKAEFESGQENNEQFTIDTNIKNVLGSQSLINQGRLKVEDTIAPEQVIQGVMGKLNDEVRINLTGQGSVGLQLFGTWAGTMTFYGTIDGNTWAAIYGQIPGTATGLVLNTTVNNIFRFHTAGLLALRVQFTTYTSGLARAILTSTPIGMLNSSSFVMGSQSQLLQQRATSYESIVYDSETAVIKDALQYPDPWNTKGYYYVGDTCSYNGQIYQCIVSHSAASFFPTNAIYWQIDQRQNKSLVANQCVSSPSAARLRVEIDLDAYKYRLMEAQLINQQIQMVNDFIFKDYDLNIKQNYGGKYGENFSLGGSGMSYYQLEEIR